MPPSGNSNGGTNNILNVTSFESGFHLTPPGGVLELVNNTGAPISNFAFTFTGTVASADASGVLTCGVAQSNFATCTVSSPVGTSSVGSGGTLGTLAMPGQPPWTWKFNAGSIAASADFELQFGSFNAADNLKTPEPTTGLLLMGGILGLAMSRRRARMSA